MAEQQELADWFKRNADRKRAGAFINTDPEYFASECADAITNGTLVVTHRPDMKGKFWWRRFIRSGLSGEVGG